MKAMFLLAYLPSMCNIRECVVYYDGTVTFSEPFDQYLDYLEAIFENLHRHELKLKASKCCFFQYGSNLPWSRGI